MAYIPHASEVTQPIDTVDRSTAAAEFRELKTHINGMSTIASATTPDIFNNTNKIISYTGAVLATGFAAAPAAGAERLLYCTGASSFTAGANLIIDGTASGNTLVVAAGYVVQVIALTATQFKLLLISPVGTAITATTATTATNLSGGTVNATSLGFIGGIGVGGTVTQITNIGTAVTLNKLAGRITTVINTWSTTSTVNFFLNNSTIAMTDTISVNIIANGGTIGLNVDATITAAGQAQIFLNMKPGLSGTGAADINFTINKSTIT